MFFFSLCRKNCHISRVETLGQKVKGEDGWADYFHPFDDLEYPLRYIKYLIHKDYKLLMWCNG